MKFRTGDALEQMDVLGYASGQPPGESHPLAVEFAGDPLNTVTWSLKGVAGCDPPANTGPRSEQNKC